MSKLQKLVVFGSGGNAQDVLDIVDAINAISETWQVVGYLDDMVPAGSEYAGFKVLGQLRDASRFADHFFINSIRSEKSYRKLADLIKSAGIGDSNFATLVHPQAGISARAELGHGVYVNYGASIAGGVIVGNHVSVGPRAIIGHDSTIGDYTSLAPGAILSGFVRLGQSCYIGAGAALRQKTAIGDRALVGIGAVVLCDVAPDTVVVGNPAKPLRRILDGR